MMIASKPDRVPPPYLSGFYYARKGKVYESYKM